MSPIIIKLCECLGLNPVPILMAVMINGNIGSAATPLGHIPNLLITGNPFFAKHGVTFLSYTVHMVVAVVPILLLTFAYLRIQYRDFHELRMTETKEVNELRREIVIWERTAASLSTFTRDSHIVRDTLLKKIKILREKLKRLESTESVSNETYRTTLEELKQTVCNESTRMSANINEKFIFFLLGNNISVSDKRFKIAHQVSHRLNIHFNIILPSIISNVSTTFGWMERTHRNYIPFDYC